MIEDVIFDLDGTLLDTSEGIIESVRYSAKALGFRELPQETLFQFVGPPLLQSFMAYYGCDRECAQKATEIFRDHYKTVTLYRAKPYGGIYELCETLKDCGVKMAVATYKPEDYAIKLLEHFGFDRYCNPMHGADKNGTLKKEDIIRMCLEELDASKENSVLIGDTEHDAKGAAIAGIPFLAVTYGFGFKEKEDEELLKYPCIGVASTPREIAHFVPERQEQ